jgi:hypothetical protein
MCQSLTEWQFSRMEHCLVRRVASLLGAASKKDPFPEQSLGYIDSDVPLGE